MTVALRMNVTVAFNPFNPLVSLKQSVAIIVKEMINMDCCLLVKALYKVN